MAPTAPMKNSRAVCWASLRTVWALSSTEVMIEVSVAFSESSWSSEAVTSSGDVSWLNSAVVGLTAMRGDRTSPRAPLATVTKEFPSFRAAWATVPVSVICFS